MTNKIKAAYDVLSTLAIEVEKINSTVLVITGISGDESEELYSNNSVLGQLQWLTTDDGCYLLVDLSA